MRRNALICLVLVVLAGCRERAPAPVSPPEEAVPRPFDCSGVWGACRENGYQEKLADGGWICSTDRGASDSRVSPETCDNGIDNDCNGLIDEDCDSTTLARVGSGEKSPTVLLVQASESDDGVHYDFHWSSMTPLTYGLLVCVAADKSTQQVTLRNLPNTRGEERVVLKRDARPYRCQLEGIDEGLFNRQKWSNIVPL